MSQQVNAILEQIEQLDEADRLLLEQRLHEMADAVWQDEVDNERADARARGIDEQAIADAIQDSRYRS